MYSKSKYIVGNIDGMTCAVVFPETIPHVAVARVFDKGTILGAGFCHYGEDGASAYGESIGLNVASRPEDAVLLSRAMAHPQYIL